MTYKGIQEEYKKIYNKTIKSCWIADVKRKMGFEMRKAHNRENPNNIKNKCPNDEIRKRIEIIINKQNSN